MICDLLKSLYCDLKRILILCMRGFAAELYLAGSHPLVELVGRSMRSWLMVESHMDRSLERDYGWLWSQHQRIFLHGFTLLVSTYLLENCQSLCMMLLALERALSRDTRIRSNETTTADNILKFMSYNDAELLQCKSLFEVLLSKTWTLY